MTQTSDLLGSETVSERANGPPASRSISRASRGGNFRPRVQDRYRQWLTHKFSSWVDQFGTSGCVGCGRCVTWCPVGIDVREELAAIAPVQAALPQTHLAAAGGGQSWSLLTRHGRRHLGRDERHLHPRDDRSARGRLERRPGQFLMLDLPGYSARAHLGVALSSEGKVYLTIRAAGASTRAITSLREGAQIGLRGPMGVGWSMEEAFGRDVVIVAGGIGLAPLAPAHRRRAGRTRALQPRAALLRRSHTRRHALRG